MSSAPWYDLRIARGMKAQLMHWHERQKAGEKPIGWKVGFGSTDAMEQLRIAAPLIGNLTDRARLDPASKVSLAGWTKPAAEAEIAVFMGKDLPGGANRDVARNAISGIAPAIELADVSFPPDDVEAILKDNIYQRHVVLGACDRTRARCVLDGLTATVVRNGNEFASMQDTQQATGDLIDIVRQVADMLAAFGERLRAGQVIMTGSITPPMWVEPGEEILFRLDPVGSVSVRFDFALSQTGPVTAPA
jgi:2-keto-4-pentenoate hydratase